MASKILKKIFGDYSEKEIKRIIPIKDKILSLEDKYSQMENAELQNQTNILKSRLSDGETLDDILPDAFAVCREASWRVLGMKHYPVQILGGIILHQGRIAEMKTGEGKTLVATLPAYLNALAGNGVHIVTVNDYLAKRDSEWMGKVYNFLGLSVGLITHNIKKEDRMKAYQADITYGTNNEIGFDYLRDNMVTDKKNKCQRILSFAIIDEVDSILIDEARTPLIISGKGDDSSDLYEQANNFAKSLKMVKVSKTDSKNDTDETYNGDFVVDEKAKNATLTQSGVRKAEKYFHIQNLMDLEHTTLRHHIDQAIKAVGVMQRDIDYIIKDNQVVIVDEFTGRIMEGRRFNEGLHQAIEAKEGVRVQSESKTLATITFQNLFKLYDKISGMTGTAATEEQEFKEIYSLDIVKIPTNKLTQRIDFPDSVYFTEEAKFNAVIEKVIACHEKSQPVLIGTVDIAKSEYLSKRLKKVGIKHNVLNAKNHQREAEIIAQAGKLGAVTIATNMAGRGTDIILGGNAEYMALSDLRKMDIPEEIIAEANGYGPTDNEDILSAREIFTEKQAEYKAIVEKEAEKVKELGGLCIIGTERHESRRIDNQLRGRAGRQGDNGESQFFLSLEDNLMRLFGSERIQETVYKLIDDESIPIESKHITNAIERAQKNIEGIHFQARRNVLQFDEVMAAQRNIIYKQRDMVLDNVDVYETVIKMVNSSIEDNVYQYCSSHLERKDWDVVGLKENFKVWGLMESDTTLNAETLDIEELIKTLQTKASQIIDKKRKDLNNDVFNQIARSILLKTIDTYWMDYIDAMDEFKRGINLRAYAQRDPVVAFRMESYDAFNNMTAEIREEVAKIILLFKYQFVQKNK